jgi:hypothetical protein
MSNNRLWTEKELEILHRDIPVTQKLKLLPGRSWRGMLSRASTVGLSLCRTGSAGNQPWSEKEIAVAKEDISLAEKVALLPGRTFAAIKLKSRAFGKGKFVKRWTEEELEILQRDIPTTHKVALLPGRSLVSINRYVGPTKVPTWSKEDLAILALGLDATTTVPMLSRKFSVWSISAKRRKLGLPRKRGRRAFQPEDYPQFDWNRSINQIAKELDVAFYTAKTLKTKALGK